jgi:hypothetical protein
MAQLDIYELVDNQRLFGREIANVYHILQSGDPDPTVTPMPMRIAEAFRTVILPSVRALQSASVEHTGLTVRNLFNDEENNSLLFSETGTRTVSSTAENMPAFLAASLSFDGFDASIRRAHKRYAGLLETDNVNGNIGNSYLSTSLTTLANLLVLGFNIVGTETPRQMRFVTVRRIKETTTKGVIYRLPENEGEADISLWNSAYLSYVLTSQVSRKD